MTAAESLARATVSEPNRSRKDIVRSVMSWRIESTATPANAPSKFFSAAGLVRNTNAVFACVPGYRSPASPRFEQPRNIEVAECVGLDQLEPVNGARIHGIAGRGQFRRVDVPDEQSARAVVASSRASAVIADDGAIGLLALPVFQQVILATQIRPLHANVKGGVGQRRGVEGIRARRRQRGNGNPAKLVKGPALHAGGAQWRREIARAHESPFADAFAHVVGVVQIR